MKSEVSTQAETFWRDLKCALQLGVHRTSSSVRYPAGFQKNVPSVIRPDF